MTVGELLSRMSSAELQEWKVYFQILDAERKQTAGSSSVMFRGQSLPE